MTEPNHDFDVFKGCDIRGRYGSELTAAFALDLGRTVGTRLEGGRLLVGGDARPSTPFLKGALLQGLMETGCHVTDLGQIPTPALYFAQGLLGIDPVVMVTASHNPPGYNGFKLMLSDWPITENELTGLRHQMAAGNFRSGSGFWDRADVLEAYVSQLVSFFPSGDGLKVVVDAGNGCLSRLAPDLLRRQGFRVVERFCNVDGRFLNRDPNPSVPEHLTGLAEHVVATQADLGVAYDGDGDRVVFVDELGRIQPSDLVLVLFVRRLLRLASTPGERTVVYDIKCSSVVAEETRRMRGTPVIERSGHTFIKTTMLQHQAALAGEISGHYFFGPLRRDDALYATLLLLHILEQTERPLSALIDEIPHYPISPDLRLPCPPEEQAPILEELRAAFGDQHIDTIDGIRVDFGDGWALARSSVTEPLITLRFEGHTAERLAQIQQLVRQRVPAIDRLLARMEADSPGS